MNIGNKLFESIVNQIDCLSSDVARAVIVKGLKELGTTPDEVNAEQMKEILSTHVSIVLERFMDHALVKKKITELEKRCREDLPPPKTFASY